MDGIIVPLVIVGIVALIAGGIAWAYVHEKKRRETLQQVAQQMGFSFEPKGPPPGAMGFGDCPLFKSGRSKRIYNVMQGAVADVQLHLFDYKYTVGSGKNSTTYNQTVAVFEMTQIKLPQFRLGPEGFFHKIGEMFGMQDIDFDTHPTFSKKYRLTSDDEATIRAAFTPTVLEFFEQHIARKWNVHCWDKWLVVYRSSHRAKPDDWPAFMEDTFGVVDVLTPAGIRMTGEGDGV